METKVYSSYKEIDRDLEILKLQKEIDVKKLSLTVDKTLESLTPAGMLRNLLGDTGLLITKSGLLKNVILPFIINKFIK
ncbi:hypothetical protein FLJC2902T_05270 [Flavobacterium limnosediminis JC2902]|uniref:Uncharacterized protein n=1 Tax=Flavobacterium limnosediminis JC2902 TaxID=1341181 RepID=V6STR9_9FLAO|nr:DUF6327 family protein [Flavobacterium limnosediminis]ESU30036.1 hypothetical protein FLJC2902T_05270 [Flavobacterium limnosediminis JC2902]